MDEHEACDKGRGREAEAEVTGPDHEVVRRRRSGEPKGERAGTTWIWRQGDLETGRWGSLGWDHVPVSKGRAVRIVRVRSRGDSSRDRKVRVTNSRGIVSRIVGRSTGRGLRK